MDDFIISARKAAHPEGGLVTLRPLPTFLRRGLSAVATLGFASFVSSALLFFYLTYKIARWQLSPVSVQQRNTDSPTQPVDEPVVRQTKGTAFLVANAHLCPLSRPGQPGYVESGATAAPTGGSLWQRLRKEPPNQFLVLIQNLLLADIQQASAFLLNVDWLVKNAVVVDSPTCWAQGWFISTGDMSSSVFVTAIAIHTYMAVVRGYRLPTWAFYTALTLMWCFVYGLAILAVIITNNGPDVGGLYVRAGAWCWINAEYQNLRLYLHYLWIFLSIGTTTVLYIVIYLHIQRQQATSDSHTATTEPPPTTSATGSGASESGPGLSRQTSVPPPRRATRHPTFLLYPLIYVLCTTPLAAGRIASMTGREVSLYYFCFAGVMIASAGWLDVVLYSYTRRSIVFAGNAPPSQETGLDTFAFMRTPAGRKYGNIVFVHGGNNGSDVPNDSTDGNRWRRHNDRTRSGTRLRISGDRRDSNHSSLKGFGAGGSEALGMAIQCDVVASLTIEQGDRTIQERIESDERGYDRGDDTASLNSRMGIIKDSPRKS